MSVFVQLEQQPEQFQLATLMGPETCQDSSVRDIEEVERLLSPSENDKSAELSSKCRSSSQYTSTQLPHSTFSAPEKYISPQRLLLSFRSH